MTRAEAESKVCAEIEEIMHTYREQEKSRYGVDTPGGLEHMGDVWRLLGRWDGELYESTSEPKPHCDYANCSLPRGHVQSCNEEDAPFDPSRIHVGMEKL